ncbi:hypothetical protein M0D69_12305 [Caballeronia sp. SEWSISQ10-4 2]|uniref:hypothetical protein n=1 Tax=Caballeronia sp. SEWSISQ10-4 2 TaxID=2937438 RepID=UPI0026553742|nr:hypothetical protein [Caballeronia sp. SEWSISQ10-4 2]MDN7178784.1 hypothetical protein [Caballeronia sp. SEWSISQ10-4 2]
MNAKMDVKPRPAQHAISTVGLFTIVGTPLPILKSILAKAAIYAIGVAVARFSAALPGF